MIPLYSTADEYLHFIGMQKPSMKDIDSYVVVQWASKWKEIARQLNIEEYLISNIEHDYPSDCVKCCGKMLSDWLEQSNHPIWAKLINALDQVSGNVAGLNFIHQCNQNVHTSFKCV